MNTEIEKSIDYLKGIQDGSVNQFDYCEKAIDIVTDQLKRGEKFEQVFNEIEAESHIGTWWEDYIKGKRQRYFPKSKADEKLPECFETDGVDNIEYDPYFCCINGKWRIVEVYNGKPISEIKAGGSI